MTIVELSLFLLGVSIGLSSSFLGVGGGLIMVPLLPLFLPLSAVETVATSLFVVMVTVFVNSLSFVRKGLVDWSYFFYIGFGSVSWAVLLSYISVQGMDVIFRLGLVLALLFILLNPLSYFNFKPSRVKSFFLGSCGGFLTGISGMGSSIFSPIFFEFKWLEKKQIVPTVNAVMFVTTISVLTILFLGHPKHFGLVHLYASLFILAGAFLSSFVGRCLNLGPYEKYRRVLLKVLVLCLLIKVLFELVFKI
ncbi:MAG: sulfite exporter TauE/SafE family protein [Bdellovibrionales bacterium]|nr:sulfite exporter TauE/SafE family protein [Bdellovibrionales bacterium]